MTLNRRNLAAEPILAVLYQQNEHQGPVASRASFPASKPLRAVFGNSLEGGPYSSGAQLWC